MKMKQTSSLILLASITLLSLTIANSARAADTNTLVEECSHCHGKDGASTDKNVPIIGGLSAVYIIDSMAAYKNKIRPCPETKYREGPRKGKMTDMCAVTQELSEADIKQLGEFYAAKKFVRAKQNADPALAKLGAQIHERRCEKCHSEAGSLAADDSGILAGQWMPYLAETFKDYKANKRAMAKKMKPKIDKLEQAEIDALVQYYGSFK